MRLVDQIMASPCRIAAGDGAGIVRDFPGPGAKNDLIAACPLRYVLDESASRQCAELFLHGPDLLTLDPRSVRLPAPLLWIEWISNPPYAEVPDTRLGLLVESDESGRRGSLFAFHADPGGQVQLTPGRIEFDLDAELRSAVAHSPDVLALRHGEEPRFDRMLGHARLHVDPRWRDFIRSKAPDRITHQIHQLGQYVWIFLPFVFAFATMLNARGALRQQPSDLSRLNAARVKRGKAPLLDHIEVRLALGERFTEAGGMRGHGLRAPARLHQVRGHLVHRGDRIFWRTAHMRGDITRIIASRTVAVTGTRSNAHMALG